MVLMLLQPILCLAYRGILVHLCMGILGIGFVYTVNCQNLLLQNAEPELHVGLDESFASHAVLELHSKIENLI